LLLTTACSTGASTACEPPGTQVTTPRSAGCIAVDGGRLLLVQDRSGRWSIPGGSLQAGETTELGAVRETLEEAGVAAIAGPPVCAVPANDFVAHACVVADAGTVRPDGVETTAARWMARDEVAALTPAQLRYPDQKPIYVVILDAATQAEVRATSGAAAPPAPP
jgi:8-oxo-dGTP pyrophosphatase MutT (NUDIX family)